MPESNARSSAAPLWIGAIVGALACLVAGPFMLVATVPLGIVIGFLDADDLGLGHGWAVRSRSLGLNTAVPAPATAWGSGFHAVFSHVLQKQIDAITATSSNPTATSTAGMTSTPRDVVPKCITPDVDVLPHAARPHWDCAFVYIWRVVSGFVHGPFH